LSQYDTPEGAENIAQTVAKIMEQAGAVDILAPNHLSRALDTPLLLAVPAGQQVQDFTEKLRAAQSLLKPFQRKGTAQMQDLASLIAWANRFKGENSALYASNSGDAPKLTCIADYHLSGPAQITDMGDPTARHGHHRATYAFPLSRQWKAWAKQSGQAVSGPEMGMFLEDFILDVIDPPLSLTSPGIAGAEASDADLRLIDIARRLDGSFGTANQLLGMAKSFTVNETADYTVAHNSTTGEATIQVKSEHIDGNGQPIRVPKLFLIAIPVFENGPAYRLPVRFQYRKSGPTVKFILTLHDPKHAMDHAFTEATAHASAETALPLFLGQSEA
jgi:hypothetical protein